MSVTTTHFALTVDAWTEVASGKQSVSIVNHMIATACVHVGASTPPIGTDAYMLVEPGADKAANFSGLGPDDKVYARAANSSGAAVVVFAGDE